MTVEPVDNPEYWARRLRNVQEEDRHHSVFRCPLDRWRAIERKHREILARHVKPSDSVLDAGCGWGRLLTLLPEGWFGEYLGIDLAPAFVELARKENPLRSFRVLDLRDLPAGLPVHDWAILVSMRPMIRRNMGEDVWEDMAGKLKSVSRRRLFLEYDPEDEGSVE